MATEDNVSVVIEKVAKLSGLTEGPHWDPKTQKLFFVDIWGQRICSFEAATKKITSVRIEQGPVGAVVPVENSGDSFIANVGTNILLVTWNHEKIETNPSIRVLASAGKTQDGVRFNDGKCDPVGRFWSGTMCELNGEFLSGLGNLYSLDSSLKLESHLSSINLSNGLAWNLIDGKFYYIDSLTYQIASFDYNSGTGSIANRQVVFDLAKNDIPGLPDGMTIDSDGNLWTAVWDGSRIIQVDPKSGKLLRTICMPAKRVTSVAFGGPKLDVLYVTTAGYGFNDPNEKTPDDDKNGGSIFTITGLGVVGLEANCFKMNLSFIKSYI